MYGKLYLDDKGEPVVLSVASEKEAATGSGGKTMTGLSAEAGERNRLVRDADNALAEVAVRLTAYSRCKSDDNLTALSGAHTSKECVLKALRDFDARVATEEEKRKNPPLMTGDKAADSYASRIHLSPARFANRHAVIGLAGEINEAARLHYKAAVAKALRRHLGAPDSYEPSLLWSINREVFDKS